MTRSVAQAVEDLVRAAVRLPDEAMDQPWVWGEYDEEGLRFALLMTHHELRDLAVRLSAARDQAGRAMGGSERIRAQYHEAYRDLTGLLHRVRDDELDRGPAPEEWPVRETVKHMIGALYGFSAVVDLALEAIARDAEQGEPSDEEFALAKRQPGKLEDVVSGGRGAVADALFDAHRRALGAMSRVADDQLERPARFWDGLMPLRFRLHRFEAHLRQHTIQIDKTLAAIGHHPTEAERLVRLIHVALAGVESAELVGIGERERAEAAAVIAGRVPDLRA